MAVVFKPRCHASVAAVIFSIWMHISVGRSLGCLMNVMGVMPSEAR
jgi:hypothetical protein